MTNELPKRKNPRLKDYDYSLFGAYFITICTKDMKQIFGEVVGEEMRLNRLGQLVEKTYLSLADVFTNIESVKHIIMPNHLHCLLLLNEESTITVSKFVQGFKSKVIAEYSQKVKEYGWQPFNKTIWQRSFHDHIVRDGREYDEIADYIVKNPMRWNNDCFNPNRHIPTHPRT